MRPPAPRWPWISLFVLQSLQLLTLLPWLMIAGLSFMVFDAPGADQMWRPWTFLFAVWSYPLWLILAGTVSWILLLRFRKRRAAVILGAAFTLPAPLLLAWLVFVSVTEH